MPETTTVGSLPKPEWLAEPERLWPVWRLQGEALARGKRRAAVEWLRHQEEAGLDIVTDGEQFRIHFVHGFLEHIDGIDWQKKTATGIRDNRYVDAERLCPCSTCGMAPLPCSVVLGKIGSLTAGSAQVRNGL